MKKEELFADCYIREEEYDNALANKVIPYVSEYEADGYIIGEKGIKLYYKKFVNKSACKTIVICHGLGENLNRYYEMIYYCLKMGYSVYAMEHRGHVRSGRLGSDDGMVSIDRFKNYYVDMKSFLDRIVIPEQGKDNLFLFAHSMGGGISARFLESYSGYFKGVVLSSPMLGINSGSIPTVLAKLLAHGGALTPWKHHYVIGHKPYHDTYNFAKANTNCEVRFRMLWRLKKENPVMQMGGASYQWVSQSYYETARALRKRNIAKVDIPVLLFQAGKDTMVKADAQERFAKYAKNCKMVRFPDAKHTLYLGEDAVLKEYYEKMFSFFDGLVSE